MPTLKDRYYYKLPTSHLGHVKGTNFLSISPSIHQSILSIQNLDGESNLKQRESPRALRLGEAAAPNLDVKQLRCNLGKTTSISAYLRLQLFSYCLCIYMSIIAKKMKILKPYENRHICAQHTVQTSKQALGSGSASFRVMQHSKANICFFCSTSYYCTVQKPARPGFVYMNMNNIDIKRLQPFFDLFFRCISIIYRSFMNSLYL